MSLFSRLIVVLGSLLSITYSHGFSAPDTDEGLATKFRERGVEFGMKDDFPASLANLRAACRLNPTVDSYWNDLGVTELRAGELAKAQKRFLKALELNPNNEVAKANLEEVKESMGLKEFNRAFKEFPQSHKVKDIKQVDPFHPALTHNATHISMSHYDILNEPFIVKRALQSWGGKPEKMDLKYIKEKYGSVRVDYYPHNMLVEPVHPFFTSFDEAVERLTNPIGPFFGTDASEPGTYIQWNLMPGFADEIMERVETVVPSVFDLKFWTDKCFSHQAYADELHQKTHIKMLLVGEKGAGMFNHQDSLYGASFQIQFSGRKMWHLCDDDQTPYLYRPGRVDAFHPDYETFPLYRQANCYQFIVEEGDLVYYPKRHWHQTMNLDTPSISYSHTMVTPQNYENVTGFLRRSCDGREYMFQPNKPFCDQLKKCFKLWQREFKKPAIGYDEEQQQQQQQHSEL